MTRPFPDIPARILADPQATIAALRLRLEASEAARLAYQLMLVQAEADFDDAMARLARAEAQIDA